MIDKANRLMNDSYESKTMKTDPIRKAKSFDELLDLKYGVVGITERDVYETKANYFVISEMLKEARKESNFTQEQLAEKIGIKKT